MGRVRPLLWGVLLAGVWLLSSSDVMPDRYGGWAPFFMQRADLEKSVKMASEARELVDPGKLWIAGDSIYIVERYKGVHIIDNSDPAEARPTGFLIAPGCVDVAVRGDVIYLDNAVDMVAFDLATKTVTTRLKNYFPPHLSPTGYRYEGDKPDDLILVGWQKTTKNGEGRP